jgi:hypothetical protein
MIRASCRFTAVQDDPASFAMDWPVFDQPFSDTGFGGRVFVLDRAGARVADRAMAAPGDRAADDALRAAGWTRTGEWRPDDFGRAVARVERRVVGDQGFLPTRPLVSLAEEASLHLA